MQIVQEGTQSGVRHAREHHNALSPRLLRSGSFVSRGSGDPGSPVSLSARPALRAATRVRSANALRANGPRSTLLSPRRDKVQRLCVRGEALLPVGNEHVTATSCVSDDMHSRAADTSGTLTPHSTRSAANDVDCGGAALSLVEAQVRKFASAPIPLSTPASSVNHRDPGKCPRTRRELNVSELPLTATTRSRDAPSEGGDGAGVAAGVGQINPAIPSPRSFARTPRALAQRLPTTVPEDSLPRPEGGSVGRSGVLPWPSGGSGLSGSTTAGGSAARVSKYELVDTGVLSSMHTLLSGTRRSSDGDMSVSKYEVWSGSLCSTLETQVDGMHAVAPTSGGASARVITSILSPPASVGVHVQPGPKRGTGPVLRPPVRRALTVAQGEVTEGPSGGATRESLSPILTEGWAGPALFGESSEASVEVVGRHPHPGNP